VSPCSQLESIRTTSRRDHPATLSLGLPRALNNAAMAAATAGKALVDDECAKKAAAELIRD
jgi:hypothetical protein